ncbi:response regulator transcription factor [Nitrolancea hollandica]|uniref:Two component transcriptional regulator, winged helix family n=1 Tax=Nitrolancea hollandica Lb TaxID=1129897 RepID=I4EHG0_9BACT|nr:response regulator transcription factor [Nitrolancea hollandica]CCF84122.1 Two component transcriptional regulator, winged helix family [Nitrolancea hollandica Lb]
MRIVVVDPDTMVGKLLRFVLGQAGYDNVVLARNSAEAIPAVAGRETDAVLMEVDLPDGDGFQLCKGLRERRYHGPIIFVSQRRETKDKVRAFKSGADDYIVEPFDPAELVARVEAVTRRYKQADQQALGTLLRVGDAELSIAELTFRSSGRPPVLLTPTEMRILECLMRNSQVTISRDTLIERTWGYEFVGESNRVDVYIRRLREKIEREPGRPEYIHTIRGIGYVFRAPARAGVFPLPDSLKGPHSDSLASSAAFAS